jgi:ABC-2 type transport system ATP-binding protein
MLKVRNLTKIFPATSSWFGPKGTDFVAVNNISFEIKDGEVVGILGPNGAGKTTTIKMLLDILTPTSGLIEYFGKNINTHRSEIMQHVAFASTYTKLPGRLTIQENLEIYGRLYSIPWPELRIRIKNFLKLFGMEDRAQQLMSTLSAGQTTRVMLAKAFLVYPKIILLDEPTAALDPDVAMEVRSFILKQQKEQGITVLLASHNMNEVTEICDRVIVLSKGIIIDDNTPEVLASRTSDTRVTLTILDGMKRLVAYTEQNNIAHQVTDRVIDINIDESGISQLLAQIGTLGISYSHISITKPTLEDYFLEIARKSQIISSERKQ